MRVRVRLPRPATTLAYAAIMVSWLLLYVAAAAIMANSGYRYLLVAMVLPVGANLYIARQLLRLIRGRSEPGGR